LNTTKFEEVKNEVLFQFVSCVKNCQNHASARPVAVQVVHKPDYAREMISATGNRTNSPPAIVQGIGSSAGCIQGRRNYSSYKPANFRICSSVKMLKITSTHLHLSQGFRPASDSIACSPASRLTSFLSSFFTAKYMRSVFSSTVNARYCRKHFRRKEFI